MTKSISLSTIHRMLVRRFMRLPEVESATGLKHDSIYRGAREGWFPAPYKLSDRASAWRSDEIENWIATRPALAGRDNSKWQSKSAAEQLVEHGSASGGEDLAIEAHQK